MKFIVWKVIGKNTSIFDDGKSYIRYALKGLDDKKNYYLNLPEKHISITYLISILKEGNIIEAHLQSNKKNINYFGTITLVKENINGKLYE